MVYSDYQRILEIAGHQLHSFEGRVLDILTITRPVSLEYAIQLVKIISKLSPLIGNMIEFSTVELLNEYDWKNEGRWVRQDPGFPDALFKSDSVLPNPGIEIKAWFPLATEITARFKDSISIFNKNHIDVALVAWLPENIIWGKPRIIDTVVVSGKSVAEARDLHYHKPPDYLVVEPEDTSARTLNLRQTNTNGYKFQADKSDIESARKIVAAWGENGMDYSPKEEYQRRLKKLLGQFVYRLDTNYAKIDRIEHSGIESFKKRVLDTVFKGRTVKEWSETIFSGDETVLKEVLTSIL